MDVRSSAVSHCRVRVHHVCAVWKTNAAPCAPHPSVSDSNEPEMTEEPFVETTDRQTKDIGTEGQIGRETAKSYVQVAAGGQAEVIFPRSQLGAQIVCLQQQSWPETATAIAAAQVASGQGRRPQTANGSQGCPSTGLASSSAAEAAPSPTPPASSSSSCCWLRSASRLCCMQIFWLPLFCCPSAQFDLTFGLEFGHFPHTHTLLTHTGTHARPLQKTGQLGYSLTWQPPVSGSG